MLSVPIDVKGTGDKAGGLSLIRSRATGTPAPLACDLLTQAYVPQKSQDGAFSVTGTDGRPPRRWAQNVAAIEEAVAGKAAKVSPQATGATWDKEVWLDYAGNVASTTFTLDDPRLDGDHRGLARRLAGGDVAVRALESRRRRVFAVSAATAFALCALLLVPAQPAYADIAGDVNEWLCGLLRDCCNWMFKAQTGVLRSIGANGILSADFAHMLTSSSDLTMHDVARGVWQVAILPIGCGVLGLVFTLKLIEISQRMDGSQSLPGVKEVVFLLVFFAVFLFLIQNSFDLMASIYEVCGLAIDRVEALFGAGGAPRPARGVRRHHRRRHPVAHRHARREPHQLGRGAGGLRRRPRGLLGPRAPALHHGRVRPDPAGVPRHGRHAPDRPWLPEELRGGLHRRRHHPRSAHIVPARARRAHRANPGRYPADAVANGLTYALQYLAMCVLLILALVKSGSWARDIVSGF